MQVSNPNNVKIYNLSAGKSLPEWISERRRRTLQKSDVDVRRRIDLIQDFDMPAVSTNVQVTKDGQYILATGIYKPRVRCFDVHHLSMKFERCFDSEAVKFLVLSEDYSKLVLLQCDRYVEFHAQYGRYYRTRIPKFGRDLAYHEPSCDLYIVGASNSIFRLNLEQGRFLSPLPTDARELNACCVNPVHHLLVCGTTEGRVEAFDPRSRHRVGILDCALSCVTADTEITSVPAVSCLSFRDGLTLGVGTTTGQVLLYDIRSSRPLLVKDHLYSLPVRNVTFHPSMDLVVSMDSKIVRLWERHSGKAWTSIEPGVELNDLCVVPDTGMMFIANEDKKILTYYIPALGPAPRWCSFLDSLTEELEEGESNTVYDDYKFVTKRELEELGLAQLIGSNLLRAYMHGYFMDARFYHKVKAMTQPFAYDEYRKKKVREKIAEERTDRVKRPKLPNINRNLAEKLLAMSETTTTLKTKPGAALLEDKRFQALFENPDFQVDEESDAFRLLNPVVTKMDKDKRKKNKKKQALAEQFDPVEEEQEGRPSDLDESATSSEDERGWVTEVKRQHKLLRREDRDRRQQEDREAVLQPAFFQLKEGEEFRTKRKPSARNTDKRLSLADRLQQQEQHGVSIDENEGKKEGKLGHRSLTFTLKKTQQQTRERKDAQEHHRKRKQLARPLRGRGKP